MNHKVLLALRATALSLFLMVGFSVGLSAQTVTTIFATGTAGSYATGSVNSAGTKNDGNMITINSSTNRGWAVFDLSSIPSGAIINSVTLKFTTYSTTLSGATNNVYGYAWTAATDPATYAGTSLYADLASGTSLNASTWSANALQTKTLNTTGVNLVSNNIGGKIVLGFVRGSTNTYNIYGYPAANTADMPQLDIDYTPTTPCNGTPGTPVATAPSSICPSVTFSLTASGVTAGSGMSYQWESSPSGAGNWQPIAGATTVTYSVTGGITANTDYHLISICSNGGATSTSNDVTVAVSSFLNCYCASAATNTADEEIYSVTVNGATNAYGCTTVAPGPGSVLNKYSNFTTLGPLTTLEPGTSASFTIQEDECDGATYYSNGCSIWIDFNQNGLFTDPGEQVYVESTTSQSPRTIAGSISIPPTATLGTTMMRITVAEGYSGTGLTPCLSYGYGETEDYLVDIAIPPACSGAVAGTATASATSVCLNQNLTLSASGYTTNVSGISLQWESSPMGAGSWTPIAGATTGYYAVTGQTVATDYRMTVTCSNGGAVDYTNTVSVDMSPFYLCYCSPLTGVTLHTCCGNYISGVAIPGTTLNNPSTTAGSGYYTQYSPSVSNQTASLDQGIQYTLNVTQTYTGYGADAWIDYDQSGTFDAGEYIALTTSGTTSTGNFIIPYTAGAGMTGLRVRHWYTSYGASGACTNGSGYETEDYVITVIPAVTCNGTPNTPVASGPSSVCANANFTLNTTGYTSGIGISFQWYASPQGAGTWTPVSGATNPSYTVTGGQTAATDYYMETTCSFGGGISSSNVVNVAMSSFNTCYCASAATNTADEEIYSVTVNGATNAYGCTTVAPGPGSVLNRYSNFTTLGALTQLGQGTNVPFTVLEDECDGATYYQNGCAIWIDFDQSGTYDASEQVYSESGLTYSPRTISGTISIPLTATLGVTGMRVVVAEGYYGTSLTPCLSYGYGETEDYLVEITTPPACLPPTGLTATNVTSSGADLSWGTVAGAAGYEYIVDQTPGSPSGSGTSTTDTTYSPSGLNSASTYYLHVRTDCGSGTFSTWSTSSFTTQIANDNASGAILLTVGAGCTGNPYTSTGASQSVGEPYPSCNNYTTGHHTVWYKFVAPASGAVRISTDNLPAGTLTDSKIGLFSATDPNDYNTFAIISCDEDGGVNTNFNSTMFATGLTGGSTYYVEVDGWGTTNFGTFCLTVDELSSSMIASAATTCATALQTPEGSNSAYTGWQSLVTNSNGGQLVAMVQNPAGGAVVNYTSGVTINTGAVRQAGTDYYLDRNYLINNATATNVNLRLFFLDAELSALSAASGGGVTLGGLNVTHQSGSTCQAAYNSANGTNTVLMQSGNGSVNGVDWIEVNTPSFSNFYIMQNTFPLSVDLGDVSATNVNTRNRVDWNTLSEKKGDYFVVERSVDGSNYTELGTVAAKGEASTYSYWDQNPVSGVNYYRLQIVDAAGSKTYSKVVTATVKGNGGFSVEAYPNPVRDVLTVKVYGTQGNNPLISVSDVTGKVIKVMPVTGNEAELNMSSMSQGIYLIRYSDNSHSQTIKVNKQ